VTVGLVTTSYAEIQSGLTEGQIVVTGTTSSKSNTTTTSNSNLNVNSLTGGGAAGGPGFAP
jgi:glycerate kinase